MLQLGLTICLFIHGLLFECVSSYTMVQKLCNPDTRGTNRSFQVLQEYHNVGIFTLLACYAALIGSCRRFGTNYRSLQLPDPWRRDIQPVPKRRQQFNSMYNSSNSNAWCMHRSSQPLSFNDSSP